MKIPSPTEALAAVTSALLLSQATTAAPLNQNKKPSLSQKNAFGIRHEDMTPARRQALIKYCKEDYYQTMYSQDWRCLRFKPYLEKVKEEKEKNGGSSCSIM